ncbi:hypothetical protein LINPERHAP1_LOCUS39976, partial [Linum perenne]
GIKPFVPLPRRLLQTIKRLLQSANKVFFSRSNEPFRLIHARGIKYEATSSNNEGFRA